MNGIKPAAYCLSAIVLTAVLSSCGTENATEQDTSSTLVSEFVQASLPEKSNSVLDLDEAKAIALNDAGISEDEAVFTKEKTEIEDGTMVYVLKFRTSSQKYEYEINALTGSIRERDTELYEQKPENTDKSDNYIGTDKAKSIALAHAGLSASEVKFSKVKRDREDGIIVYEVEFYCGKAEYEYDIDAVTGEILEYDIDFDD